MQPKSFRALEILPVCYNVQHSEKDGDSDEN